MSWDDGSHAKVKKVQLTFDDIIYSIQVTYDGVLQSQLRGSAGPKSAEFTLDSDEYITALSAYGKTLSTQDVITALTFTTNKRTFGPYGNKSGFQISVPEASGKQISGFHGTSGNVLNSIDVHYAPKPTGTGSGSGSGTGSAPQKLDAQGGKGGTAWDDGSDHDDVRKVHVGQGQDGVSSINIVYKKGSQEVEGGEHGKKTLLGFETFEVDAEDYIVAVQVTYDEVFGQDSEIITSLTFYTFKGKTSPPYGLETEKKFLLKGQNGGKLVGFHGRAGEALHALGAYFSTATTPLMPPKKTRVYVLEDDA